MAHGIDGGGSAVDPASEEITIWTGRQAQFFVLEAVALLDALPNERAHEPLELYLTGYHVLRAAADPHAPALLARGHALLHERALRAGYLQDVEAHRRLGEVYAGGMGGGVMRER